MRKYLALFTLLSFVQAAELSKKIYQIYAPTIFAENGKVTAEGGVVIYNKGSVFSAQKIVYDQNSSILELIGDVYVSEENGAISKNDYLKVDLKKRRYAGDKLFLFDKSSDLWIRGNSANSKDGKYRLYNATISSCNTLDPDWKFTFYKGAYNSNHEYVTLNHPTFYFKGVPLLYLPWFAFPTNTKRHTGLLKPKIGFESSENLLFVQPIFIAPAKNWDIELNPQIRLNRGIGMYGAFRFVDTNHSKGAVRFGLFDEKDAYASKHNLKNNVHKGIELSYQNSKLLSNYLKKDVYKDALLIDFTTLNDIDYINLKQDGKYAVNKLVTSKMNYYITDDDEYLGLYAKYFIDTEKLSNDDTLQTLPSFQYHKFIKNFSYENFLYAIDYKFKNNYRKEGLRATQHEIALPLIYNRSFFNDFINFSASENFYFSRVNYHEANSTIQDYANYFSNYHKFSVSSDLSKKYPTFTHNMQLGASYIVPSVSNKSGYFADFIPFNTEKESIRLKFNEYFYDLTGFDYLTHRMTQNIYLENDSNSFDDLENELIYKFSKNFYISNTLIYSHEYNKLKKIQSGLYYNDKLNTVRIDHTYQSAPNLDKINYLTTDLSRKVNRRYEVFAGVDYDFDESFTKEWRLGWSMRKKCWDYKVRYSQSVTPSLTSGGTQSIKRESIYLFVKLANIGGVELKNEKDHLLNDSDNLSDIDLNKDSEPIINEELESDIENNVEDDATPVNENLEEKVQ